MLAMFLNLNIFYLLFKTNVGQTANASNAGVGFVSIVFYNNIEMFCERCPLHSFSSRNTSTSVVISILYFLFTFYILVILILTIFSPHFFCAPGSSKNTLRYPVQQDVISLAQNQGKSCVAEPQHKSAVPRMAT